MTTKLLHENLHYTVEVIQDSVESNGHIHGAAYAVVNRETGVNEFVSPSLPEAIYNAESFDMQLVNKPWNWLREVDMEFEPEGGGVDFAFDFDDDDNPGGVLN